MTSHKRPFVGGIGLLNNVSAEGEVSFVKHLQRSPTGQLIPLDCCVSFCEKLEGENVDVSLKKHHHYKLVMTR